MSFDTVLNIIWLLAGASALATLGYFECRRSRPRTNSVRLRASLAVIIAVFLLFPCVSASDDLMSLQALPWSADSTLEPGRPLAQKSGSRAASYLAHFFDALQGFRIAAPVALSVALDVSELVQGGRFAAHERKLPCFSGRAPPANV